MKLQFNDNWQTKIKVYVQMKTLVHNPAPVLLCLSQNSSGLTCITLFNDTEI